jgi:hypothetical protein
MFRYVPNWNLLAPITRGRIEVGPPATRIDVYYRLEFARTVLMSAAMFALAMVVIVAMSRNLNLIALAVFLVVWVGFLCLGIATAVWRFRAFLRQVGESMWVDRPSLSSQRGA